MADAQVGWQRMPIKRLYADLYDGPHATPKPASAGPIFLGIKNITEDGRLDLSQVRHIAEEDFPKWTRRVLPQPGDIVFTYEATLNRYAVIPRGFRGCLGRRLALIRLNPDAADTRFLFYAFFGEDWRRTIQANMLSGSTVDRVPLTHFPNFQLNVPHLPTQRKIAAILSAYDDLIENNTRRIKILEEMARAIYREWFVDFRFPGHEKVKMVDSPLGKMPEGWVIYEYSELLESALGGDWGHEVPTEKEQNQVRIIRGRDFDAIRYGADCEGPLRYITEASLEKRRLTAGDIIVENSVNAQSRCVAQNILITDHALLRLGWNVIAASFCKVFRAKNRRLTPLIHLNMKNLHESGGMLFYQNVATNGIGNFQSKRFVEAEAIILPPAQSPLFEQMVSTFEALTGKMALLARKIANLRATRDLLLPKLISGEIDVSELDIQTERPARMAANGGGPAA